MYSVTVCFVYEIIVGVYNIHYFKGLGKVVNEDVLVQLQTVVS